MHMGRGSIRLAFEMRVAGWSLVRTWLTHVGAAGVVAVALFRPGKWEQKEGTLQFNDDRNVSPGHQRGIKLAIKCDLTPHT